MWVLLRYILYLVALPLPNLANMLQLRSDNRWRKVVSPQVKLLLIRVSVLILLLLLRQTLNPLHVTGPYLTPTTDYC